MTPPEAAAERLVRDEGAVLVAVYGSFASGTQTASSDLDLVAFAPLPAPRHLAGPVLGRELDAWLYPLGHPLDDPEFVRLDPLVCLHDEGNRFGALAAAVAETRRKLVVPADAAAREGLRAWADKMLVRAASGGPEGLHRYHWLVSELPELWCAAAGVPWEGPKKALAALRRDHPERLSALEALWAGPPDPEALARWLGGLPR